MTLKFDSEIFINPFEQNGFNFKINQSFYFYTDIDEFV